MLFSLCQGCMCGYCCGSSQAPHEASRWCFCPRELGSPAAAAPDIPAIFPHHLSAKHRDSWPEGTGWEWPRWDTGMGRQSKKREREGRKGVLFPSQNQVSVSILSALQSLGKITHFHAGGICWNVEEKTDPLYKTPLPCVHCSYELNYPYL